MHALIVVANPFPRSLSHGIAARIARGATEAGHSAEIADLAAEGFDPRFTLADRAVHHREAAPPPDVIAEQARLDRADDLVLVYPVYWWSFPGLLKGWFDRVFTNGWAFEDAPNTPVTKKLGHLRAHLVGVAGVDSGVFERHGYARAMRTQIDHGIFGYCGAQVATSQLLTESESSDPQDHLGAALALGRGLFDGARVTA